MSSAVLSFTLHLGSPKGSCRIDEFDRVSAIHKVTMRFDAFTLEDGKGFFDGNFEDVLLIHVATNDIRLIAELAEDLRRTFSQDGVGIAHAGRYVRASESARVEDVEVALGRLSFSSTTD